MRRTDIPGTSRMLERLSKTVRMLDHSGTVADPMVIFVPAQAASTPRGMETMITRFRSRPFIAVAFFAMSALIMAPAAVEAQLAPSPVSVPVVGTVVNGGTFTGTMVLRSFRVQNGELVALTTISGILTNAAGVPTSVVTAAAVPTQVTLATCDILHLDLGPLSLNLLGLQVDLSEVILDITAQAGPGNLLGNLLCAVAGLLDGGGLLTELAALLNAILRVLG